MAPLELRWRGCSGPGTAEQSTSQHGACSSSEPLQQQAAPLEAGARRRTAYAPLASLTQGVVTAATGAGLTMVLRRALGTPPPNLGQAAGKDVATPSAAPAPPAAAPPPPPPQPDQKPAHDVVAGAMARAASQSTIHPLDTMKVRMQTGRAPGAGQAKPSLPVKPKSSPLGGLSELKGLYKGVVGAATGAGLIIGTYFAFYSTTKRFLKDKTTLSEGATAFVAGAAAALGSSVVKVPLAVCIRSVQAGIYRNVAHAASEITKAAGVRGLFTGFLPTVLEDVPDMAVKFAVYETMRAVHRRMKGDRQAHTLEDLVMGGVAGAAAAAATTPLDVLKTVMMCSASQRPTIVTAAQSIMREGKGLRPFFRGVGPRALSNGLNSAIFFCFFEAIRQVLIKQQHEKAVQQVAAEALAAERRQHQQQQQKGGRSLLFRRARQQQQPELVAASVSAAVARRPAGSPAACLSLALPLPGWGR